MFRRHKGHRYFLRAELNTRGYFQPTGLAVTAAALVVCWWSLIETALDFALADSDTGLAATIGTRLIVVLSGLAVVLETRIARQVFCFLCGMSVLALAPTITIQPDETLVRPAVSIIDCATKLLFVACVFFSSTKKTWTGVPVVESADNASPKTDF
jgi:hypothetical protein